MQDFTQLSTASRKKPRRVPDDAGLSTDKSSKLSKSPATTDHDEKEKDVMAERIRQQEEELQELRQIRKDESIAKHNAHGALEWIIDTKVTPVFQEAQKKWGTVSDGRTWCFQDVKPPMGTGNMIPVHESVAAMLHRMTCSSWADTLTKKYLHKQTLLDVYKDTKLANVDDWLNSGRIIPLYDGLSVFGGGAYYKGDVLQDVAKKRIYQATKLIIVTETENFGVGLLASLESAIIWCIDVGAPGTVSSVAPGTVSSVITQSMTSASFILIPMGVPEDALMVISYRHRLYAFPMKHCHVNSWKALKQFENAQFTLMNLIILKQHSSATDATLMNPTKFKREFQRTILDKLNNPPPTWTSGLSTFESRILSAVDYLLHYSKCPDSNMKWVSCQIHNDATSSDKQLFVTIDGKLDIRIDWGHLDIYRDLDDSLTLSTFFTLNGSNSCCDKFHFWILLHRTPHCYDVSVKWSNPAQLGAYDSIKQMSRHQKREAVIQSMDADFRINNKFAFWNSLVYSLTDSDFQHLYTKYDYGSNTSYTIQSKSLDNLATMWHSMAMIDKRVYEQSMFCINPTKIKAFIDRLKSHYFGVFRIGLHATDAIVPILEKGFDMAYVQQIVPNQHMNGAAFGKGIYLGWDDHIAHRYNKGFKPDHAPASNSASSSLVVGSSSTDDKVYKDGNVILCMMGWQANNTLQLHEKIVVADSVQFTSPCGKAFALTTTSHWNGFSASDPADIFVCGEINAKVNVPEATRVKFEPNTYS